MFVSGLPMDARPRELHLLFRAYKVGDSFNCTETQRSIANKCYSVIFFLIETKFATITTSRNLLIKDVEDADVSS